VAPRCVTLHRAPRTGILLIRFRYASTHCGHRCRTREVYEQYMPHIPRGTTPAPGRHRPASRIGASGYGCISTWYVHSHASSVYVAAVTGHRKWAGHAAQTVRAQSCCAREGGRRGAGEGGRAGNYGISLERAATSAARRPGRRAACGGGSKLDAHGALSRVHRCTPQFRCPRVGGVTRPLTQHSVSPRSGPAVALWLLWWLIELGAQEVLMVAVVPSHRIHHIG